MMSFCYIIILQTFFIMWSYKEINVEQQLQ